MIELLNYLQKSIPVVEGVSPNSNGYLLWLADGSRLATDAEILQATKLAKIDELKLATSTAINSGFSSSALGSPYHYDSALPQDQINLLGALLSGIDADYTCTGSNGVKAQVMHTHAQIAQVFADGANWVKSNKTIFWIKAAEVQAANVVDEVEAVAW